MGNLVVGFCFNGKGCITWPVSVGGFAKTVKSGGAMWGKVHFGTKNAGK